MGADTRVYPRWAFRNGERHQPVFEDRVLAKIDRERGLYPREEVFSDDSEIASATSKAVLKLLLEKAKLTVREWQAIRHRLGGLTQYEIAPLMGITQRRVSYLLEHATTKMRRANASETD